MNVILCFLTLPKYEVWIRFGFGFQMVEEKARFNNNPTNFAVAKTLLMKEKDMAQQKGDEDVSVQDECRIWLRLEMCGIRWKTKSI